MKKTLSPAAPLVKASFSDLLDENPIIQWISRNGLMLLTALAVIFISIFFVYRSSSGNSGRAELDYFNAENDMAIFEKEIVRNPPVAEKAFDQLAAVIKRHPELLGKYEGLMAQALITHGKFSDAKPYAESTLIRTSQNDLQNLQQFAAITLSIGDNHLEEALKQSIILKNTLLNEAKNHALEDSNILFAMNLLRIAMLQQALNLKSEELQSWQEWKQFAGISQGLSPSPEIKPQAFQTVIDHFAKGNISLLNYINIRIQNLESRI